MIAALEGVNANDALRYVLIVNGFEGEGGFGYDRAGYVAQSEGFVFVARDDALN